MIKGPGGIRDIKINDIKDIASDVGGKLINKIPGLSQENASALQKIKDSLMDKIKIPETTTIGTIITKPPTTSPSAKPEVAAPSVKPEGWYKFGGISGWDKFKNTMGKIGEKLGLKTHEITDDDYVFNPKNKKWEFDWKVARENDAKRSRPTETQFDPSTVIGLASKALTKGAM
jgi:hypothetical protein